MPADDRSTAWHGALMNRDYGVYVVVALLVILIETVASNLLAIGGITPDLLLVVIVSFALHKGQLPGVLFGFASGLVFDIVSTDVLGSNALVKLLAGYCAGFFHREDASLQTSIGSPRFIGVLLGCALVHNAVYLFLYTRPADIPFVAFYLKNGIAAALYTTALALLPFFYASRQRGEDY